MPKLLIDGREIEVEPGTTILNAARRLGIDIPVFCYHDGLSVAANCRMCLVEVKGVPKPVPSCEMQVRDGMEVLTQSDFAKEARRSTVEFILLNHPVDCPICDQAGECILQDHYHDHDFKPSRINIRKVRKAKALVLGPNVVLDRERCINCTRCVRFCREVSHTEQLVQVKRGNETEIATFAGREFTDAYSLCTVDICPVGALTSRHFRFRERVWWLKTVETICPECSRGCNLYADYSGNTIHRLRPRPNQKVNGFWACDEGRLAFSRHFTNRLQAPFTTEMNGQRLNTTFDQAVDKAAELLMNAVAGRSGILMGLTPALSLEEAAAALRLAQRCQPGNLSIVLLGSAGGTPDSILKTGDMNANSAGIARLAKAMSFTPISLQDANTSLAQGRFSTTIIVGDDFDPAALSLNATRCIRLTAFSPSQEHPVAAAIPVASHYEKNGLFQNCTGEIQEARRVVALPEGARTAHVALALIARKMNVDLGFKDLGELRNSTLALLGISQAGPQADSTPGSAG